MKELNAEETRVLAVLVEKELTTPEQYPLTLNALTNACNQKSNRFPVVSYDTGMVKEAVQGLCSKTFAMVSDVPGSRSRKYSHFFTERFNFVPGEAAILCELMLRGPQTVGELRNRANRMHPFEDLSAVESHLKNLQDVSPPWIVVLPRQPGRKEQRYMHMLMGMPDMTEIMDESSSASSGRSATLHSRVTELETEVTELRQEIKTLQEALQTFKSQFE